MIRKAFTIIAISLLLCITSPMVFAQNAGTSGGAIDGLVTDRTNQAVPGATVSLFPEGASPLAPTSTEQTDARGYFAFTNLPPGNYSVAASRDFYVSTTTTNLGGGNQSLSLTLPLSQ